MDRRCREYLSQGRFCSIRISGFGWRREPRPFSRERERRSVLPRPLAISRWLQYRFGRSRSWLPGIGSCSASPRPVGSNRRCLAPGLSLEPLLQRSRSKAVHLPGSFRSDPADLFIVATARVIDAALMTPRPPILDYAAHGHLTAIPAYPPLAGSARQEARSHQEFVDRAGALPALADRPDDQRLAAPHVAGGKDLWN